MALRKSPSQIEQNVRSKFGSKISDGDELSTAIVVPDEFGFQKVPYRSANRVESSVDSDRGRRSENRTFRIGGVHPYSLPRRLT